jgi:acyl carrier protein
MSDAATAVHSVLTGTFEVAPQDLTPGATLGGLDLDSLSLAELALALQEQLGIRIAEHEAARNTTVDGLIATIEAKLAAAGAQ